MRLPCTSDCFCQKNLAYFNGFYSRKTQVRFYIVLCSFVISLLSHTSYSQTLSAKIKAIIKKELPHATVGVLIKDADTGQIIYSKNQDKLLFPASSMKLFTAAAALYELKPNYHFLTSLAKKNQDFYITFSGSPSLTIDNLNGFIVNLKKNDVKIIKGNIILDTSQFKPPFYTGGVSYDDLGWYYSAPDTAIILNENSAPFDFITAKKIGMPVQIIPKTPENGITIINNVITASKEQAKDHCSLNIEVKSNNTLNLFGCLAQENKPKTMPLAVPNPILYAKYLIKKSLTENNITLKGRIINGRTPADAQVITSLHSANLVKLITHMLNESDNLYANSLTKQLAYVTTGDGTYKQGAFAIKKILGKHTHLDMTQIELADGVGTRYNLVTPEQIVVLLTDLYRDKNMRSIFLTSLPRAGKSGTLKDRMKKTKLEKIVYAKTGSMHDISSLSGFIFDPKGHKLIFSIIINGINKPISTAKSLEEQILLTVSNSISSTPKASDFA